MGSTNRAPKLPIEEEQQRLKEREPFAERLREIEIEREEVESERELRERKLRAREIERDES